MLSLYFKILRFLKKKQFRRHVSLGDLVFSREDTARFYNFGQGSTCYNNVLILGDVVVGEDCWIGPNVILDGSGGLKIGDRCTIAAGVHIYTHHSLQRKNIDREPVSIGNDTYIGPNSVVQMGVRIGKHVVVGALSFVNKNIPSHGKWLGRALVS